MVRHFHLENSWICHTAADSGKLKVQWRGGWMVSNAKMFTSTCLNMEGGKANNKAISHTCVGSLWGFHSSSRIQVHRIWCTVAWLLFTNTSKAQSVFIFRGYMGPRTHTSWNPQSLKAICSFETSGNTNLMTMNHLSQTTWTFMPLLSLLRMRSIVKCELLRKIKVRWWMKLLQLWVFVCSNDTYFHSPLYEQLNHSSLTEDQTVASFHLHSHCLTGLHCSHMSNT